ncbi:hypothetical protein [Actibacterium lipolyticum]|uniref:VPLPA-CTERM sorting domain-containing protein n=1 Tax=Actibacterium lipolyticum TaxID=1524263 RepID=A0A238KU85_9RHOB|nr:hypothetical protein [Actibacterium lipolyticum]SMX46277.1 hypothetical protein COL8621_03038 [Actibacterium lipolyticum]
MTKAILAASAAALLLVTSQAVTAASVTVFTDETSYYNALESYTLVDFEGIAPANGYGTPEGGAYTVNTASVVDGVTFTADGGTLGVISATHSVLGTPYPSDVLFSNNGYALTADLTTAGSGYTAVAGTFGSLLNDALEATVTIMGLSGILATETLTTEEFGVGNPISFLGFTVHGDEIVSVTFDATGNFEGIDDFSFGLASVPVTPALPLLGGAIGLLGLTRRKRAA